MMSYIILKWDSASYISLWDVREKRQITMSAFSSVTPYGNFTF